MWQPGMFVAARGSACRYLGIKPGEDDQGRYVWPDVMPLFVVAVQETGYGTRGKKWRALVLADGRLITLNEAWAVYDRWEIWT